MPTNNIRWFKDICVKLFLRHIQRRLIFYFSSNFKISNVMTIKSSSSIATIKSEFMSYDLYFLRKTNLITSKSLNSVMLLELISIRNTCSKDLRYALKCRNRMATADYKEAKIRIYYMHIHIFANILYFFM